MLQRRYAARRDESWQAVKLAHPLKLSTAIKFGLLFAVVMIIVEFALDSFGSVGVYITSAVAGLTDVNAITLSVSKLAGGSQLDHQVAGMAIVVAALVNMLTKGVIVSSTGSRELRQMIVRPFGVVILAGVIGMVAVVLAD